MIKEKITEKFQEQKTSLFNSNGTIFGRDWKDLTEKYKKFKDKEIGRIYPMNIFYGDMLRALIERSLKIESNYNEDQLTLNVSIDSVRMNIDYAEDANKQREFISFSEEEKEELIRVTYETIKEHFEAL